MVIVDKLQQELPLLMYLTKGEITVRGNCNVKMNDVLKNGNK